MLLSISDIAWPTEHDTEMYRFLRNAAFKGLEIAPTRIFPENPYKRLAEARRFAIGLREEYGLTISSMQSIWYGRSENIFGTDAERETLIDYTKEAIEFAVAIGCGNLVFGCPKNRNIPEGVGDYEVVVADFFARIAGYAATGNTVIALEPNPPVYNTNFINTTEQAIGLCRKLNLDGFKVNIDTGAMIASGESALLIAKNLDIINHIHISEPKLAPLEQRRLHREILALPFERYVSIEMGNNGDLEMVKRAVTYLAALTRS
jgi:sugar phosphate isomerase/epimerase